MLENLGDRLESGVMVAGAYRLEEEVGAGGMGVVWAARESATGRPVALKFLHAGTDADKKQVGRFLREARAAMAVSHPNITRVEAVLETETGAPFLVMELLQGESLRSLLRRRGALEPREVASLLGQVVDAVGAAHAKGIVHRDLKPENVFLVNGTDVRVLDFGIAKRTLIEGDDTKSASLTSTGDVLGTPVYMAPEQIYGEDVDTRADVWALGIVIYECLAGKRPTDGDGFGPIMRKITRDRLVPLEEARPGLPAALPQIVGRMLARERHERPALHEVRDVLTAVAEGRSAPEPAPRTLRLPHAAGPSPEAPTAVGLGVTVQQPLQAPKPPPPAPRTTSVAERALVAGGVLLTLGFAGVYAWNTNERATAALFGGSPAASTTIAPPKITFDASLGARPSPEEELVRSNAFGEAVAAKTRRDGHACLAALNSYDGNTPDPAARSTGRTDPSVPYRAMCLMLIGRCSEGRALYRQWHVALADAASESSEINVMADNCEGDDLLPLEAVFRPLNRITANASPASPVPHADAAQCKAWKTDWEARLSNGSVDASAFEPFRAPFERHLVSCYAFAGSCDEARRTFDAMMRKYPAATNDPLDRLLTFTPCNKAR